MSDRVIQAVLLLLIAAVCGLYIGGALLFKKTNDTAVVAEGLAQANQNRAVERRLEQLQACQRSNRQLRFVINQRIVRPFETVVSIAATPSGDPAFDVFVPLYQAALDQLEPVPYSICRNTYPPDGSEPHPPFYRDARLPPPLRLDMGRSEDRDGRSPESPGDAGGDVSEAPTGSSQPGPSSDGSTGGAVGGSGQNPPEPPNPPSPPNPPPDSPGLLDPICDLTGSLGLPLC